MNKKSKLKLVFLLITVIILMLFISCNKYKNYKNAEEIVTQNKFDFAEKTFNNICSGCHGEKVETFVDRKWKFGKSKDSLMESIRNGYEDLGMPSFRTTFSEENISELADYILNGIENNKYFDIKDEEITSNIFNSKLQNIKLDTIANGIRIPWGMAFLPDNELLITEKSGKLYKLNSKKKLQNIEGVPVVFDKGQGGLLDITIDPNFLNNKYIYFSYTISKIINIDTLATTAVMRAKLIENKLVDKKNIFVALPFSKTKHHFGSRLQFGNDGTLYISVGERGNEKENPQNLSNFLGKIHRINADGSIPKDNPFVNQVNTIPSIYSYGHRNPQGLTINPTTGELWINEHGPRGGDEINKIKKGKNYGWPVITYGINYDGKPISSITKKEGMEQPELYWTPSIAPSGITFVTGNKYPNWKGDILSGSLRFRYLNRTDIKNYKISGEEEILLRNIGKLRNVKMGNDGYIYIAVDQSKRWTGGIFRLVPID